jgi:hypothetical protein
LRKVRIAAAACLTLSLALMGLTPLVGQEQTAPAMAPPKVMVGRSKVMTKFGIVAASQPLAARAGVQILERGGNAIDAAIAANAVAGTFGYGHAVMSDGTGVHYAGSAPRHDGAGDSRGAQRYSKAVRSASALHLLTAAPVFISSASISCRS